MHRNLKLLYQIIDSLRATDKGFYTKTGHLIVIFTEGMLIVKENILNYDPSTFKENIKFWSQYLQPEKKISFQGLKELNSTYKSDITLKLRSFMFCFHRHVSFYIFVLFFSVYTFIASPN